jgi:NOL1/NOP2/fmu family ribosome biogenesis protein
LNRILEFFKGAIEIEQVDFHGLSSGVTSQDVPLDFDPEKVARCWPHRQGTGGFFVSKIRKIDTTHHTKKQGESKLQPKNPFTLDMSKSLFKKVNQRLTATYGIQLDAVRHLLAASKEQIYLCSPDLMKLQGQLHFEKTGIPILKIDRDLYRPTHYLGNLLGHLATKNVITFDDTQIQIYSEGKDVDMNTIALPKKLDLPYQIIKRQEFGMSVVKILPDMIKNKWGR